MTGSLPVQTPPVQVSVIVQGFMSSQALGVLLQLKKAMDPLKGQIVIAGIRPELHKVFKITNLHKMFMFKDTLEKALAEFDVYVG